MISKFGVDLISDVAGLLGGVALVKPVWRANKLAKQRFRLESIALSDTDPDVIHKLRQAASTRIGTKIYTWDRTDELFVIVGILLVTFSFGIKILWPILMGPEGHI